MAKEAIKIKVEPIKVPVTTAPKIPPTPSEGTSEILQGLPKYERRIFEYLSRYPRLQFTRIQIATALRLGKKSSRLTLALRRLKQLDLIQERYGKFQVK